MAGIFFLLGVSGLLASLGAVEKKSGLVESGRAFSDMTPVAVRVLEENRVVVRGLVCSM